MSIIHIAGFPVQIGSKYRQRCAWCGAVLIDGDMSCEMVATSDGRRTHGPSKYELGALVDVTINGSVTGSAVVAHEDGAQLPANACVGPPKLRVVSGEKA